MTMASVTQETVGRVAVGASLGGFTLQTLTAWTSLAVLMINLMLGVGGLYFMWRKHIHSSKKRDRRDGDEVS